MRETEKETRELLDAKYHCREQQVLKITEQAQILLRTKAENTKNNMQVFILLLTTPPYLLYKVFNRYVNGEVEMFEKAGMALQVVIEGLEVLWNLSKVSAATNTNCRMTHIIDIDSDNYNTIILSQITPTFKKHPEVLNEAIDKGHAAAVKTTLELVEQENHPLMRLRRDMAEQAIALTQTLDGGLTGTSPTKIPGVDLRYYYPKWEKFPQLSLVVNPL